MTAPAPRGGRRVAIVVVAVAAALGAAAGLWFDEGNPLLRTDAGQRALQRAADATATPPPADLPVARIGARIPDIALPGLDGRTVTLPAAYAGRPMLVNFWASWCAPCIEEMPELDRYAASQGPDGVQVVGIALDGAAPVADFLARVPVRYPVLIDAPGPRDSSVQLGNLRGVLPYTVLVDAQGRLAKQKIGPFARGEVDGWVGTTR